MEGRSILNMNVGWCFPMKSTYLFEPVGCCRSISQALTCSSPKHFGVDLKSPFTHCLEACCSVSPSSPAGSAVWSFLDSCSPQVSYISELLSSIVLRLGVMSIRHGVQPPESSGCLNHTLRPYSNLGAFPPTGLFLGLTLVFVEWCRHLSRFL